jgi:hypothetical protein
MASMRRSRVSRCVSIGSGLAVAAAVLVAGGSEVVWLAAFAGLSTALIGEIAGWLWRDTHPRKRRVAHRAAAQGAAQQKRPTAPVQIPVYAAQVGDLGPNDFVRIECMCGRAEVLTSETLATAGVAPGRKLTDLGHRMRCRDCVERGCAIVSVKQGKRAAKPLPV